MGEQRQQFRFRLPWLAQPRSPAQPRFSSEKPRLSSNTNQPTTSIPIQRLNQSPKSSSLPTTKSTTVVPPSTSSPTILPSILSTTTSTTVVPSSTSSPVVLPSTLPTTKSQTIVPPSISSPIVPPSTLPTHKSKTVIPLSTSLPVVSPSTLSTTESTPIVLPSTSSMMVPPSALLTTKSTTVVPPSTSSQIIPPSVLSTTKTTTVVPPATSSPIVLPSVLPTTTTTTTIVPPSTSSPPSAITKPPSSSRAIIGSQKTITPSNSRPSSITAKPRSPSRAIESPSASSRATASTKSPLELGKSKKPIDFSSLATSKESANKVSDASPKTALMKLEATLGGLAQSISSLVKPQDQGSLEPSNSRQPRPSEPRTPLQKNESKVEIMSSKTFTPQEDSNRGEGIRESGPAKGLISIAPPLKETINSEHQLLKVNETSYIGKQIKSTGPSQRNTSVPLHETPDEATSRPTEIKEGISKLVSKLTERPELGEKQIVVITLTGENKGASMVISSEQDKKEKPIQIHRGYKTDPDESLESSTDEETRTKRKGLDEKPSSPTTAYVNNNVQSVNNSIVVEASVTERNPGVHLLMSQDTSEAVKENRKSKHVEARKAEFTSTRSERLTHEPTVRRRCLRGLFLDSSDSESENPNKPRRHGCRYSCGSENTEF